MHLMSKTRIKLLFFFSLLFWEKCGWYFPLFFSITMWWCDCLTIIDHPFCGLILSHVLLFGRIYWGVTCVTMAHLLFVDTSELTDCWWVILTSTRSMLAHTDAGGHSRNVGLFWDWETSDQHSCCALNFTQTIASVDPNELDWFSGQSNDFHQDFISAWSLSSWEEITAGYCISISNYSFNWSSITQESSLSLKKKINF